MIELSGTQGGLSMKANARTVISWIGVACSIAVACVGCCREASTWSIDEGYSDALLAIGENYKAITGHDAALTVDAIQIFGPTNSSDHYETVESIRTLGLIYESSERDFILKLFAALRQQENRMECGKIPKGGSLYILAYDRDLMRVGCLKYYDCANSSLGAVSRYGSGSVLFSTAFRQFLEALRKPLL